LDTFKRVASISVPISKVSVTFPRLSLLSLFISERPSRVLSLSSWGIMISFSTSPGLAPGQRVLTLILGFSTSGVSCTGTLNKEMKPNRIIRIAPTVTVTGNFMERSIIPMVIAL